MQLILQFFTLFLIFLIQAQKLERVFIIHRHGHRNPIRLYPIDPNYSKVNSTTLGELTMIGETQGRNLGDRLGSFYRTLLNIETIDAKSVFARSSNTSKTIKTGTLVMKALLKVQDYNLVAIPYFEDYVIAQFGACTKYEEEYNKLKTVIPLEHQNLLNQYRAQLVALGKLSGLTLDSVKKVSDLYDTILCDAEAGLKLPYWAMEVYPDGLSSFVVAHLKLYTHTPFMLKRKTGPLIKDIRAFLNNEEVQESQLPKLFNWTDALAFELYKAKNGKKVVKIRYFPLEKPEYEVFLAKCNRYNKPSSCNRTMFNKITQSLVVEDIHSFCGNPWH